MWRLPYYAWTFKQICDSRSTILNILMSPRSSVVVMLSVRCRTIGCRARKGPPRIVNRRSLCCFNKIASAKFLVVVAVLVFVTTVLLAGVLFQRCQRDFCPWSPKQFVILHFFFIRQIFKRYIFSCIYCSVKALASLTTEIYIVVS